MSKKVIINAAMEEETRIAIVDNNRLLDLNFETATRTKRKGNIYKGIVTNIEDGLNAAFIEFGENKQAFLPLSEIRVTACSEELSKKKLKVSNLLTRGQEIIIQVTKDEISNKGAAVTTYLSLPGRYIVLTHSNETGGAISKKIQNENSRQYARNILSSLKIPTGISVIIRTAGITCTSKELLKDFQLLCEIWKQINRGAKLGRAPTVLYHEPDIIIKTIRDYYSKDVTEIIIDDEEAFKESQIFSKKHMPDLVKYLKHHKKKEPIFQFYNIEKAINKLFDRNVQLYSGGYLTIEQTEAFVSIDVNSGSSTKEDNHESTVYKTNMEAAEEIARQLRLRDLGGIIIIDFIDMMLKKHKRNVERHIYELMKEDKAHIKINQISSNGTLELTRQRLRQSHRLISHTTCKNCEGTGRVRDIEGLSILALRNISGYLSKIKMRLATLIIKLPLEVANIINNKKRREIIKLCDFYKLELEILGDNYLTNNNIEFKNIKRGQAGLEAAQKDYNISQLDKIHRIKKDLPTPSIGPVPTFINKKALFHQSKINKSYHFSEDSLTQALFGSLTEENIKQYKKIKLDNTNVK